MCSTWDLFTAFQFEVDETLRPKESTSPIHRHKTMQCYDYLYKYPLRDNKKKD